MKKKIFLVGVIAAMVWMAVFVSCNKDNNSSKGNDNPSDEASIINAVVVNGSSYIEIAAVKAYTIFGSYPAYQAASAEYKDGGFKLNLPKTVPAEYLEEIGYYFAIPSNIAISDREAKTADLRIFAYNSIGDEIGEFVLDVYSSNEYDYAYYTYVDRDVIIKGSNGWYDDYSEEYYTEEYDYSFKKGWNVVYDVFQEDNNLYLYTTKKPSNLNFRWYYYDYNNWKKKSPNNKERHQNPFSKTI
jgi:hypothetical protein